MYGFSPKIFLLGSFLALIMWGLSSCVVTKEEVVYLNDQIVALNSRVNRIQETVDEKLASDIDAKIEPLRVNQAEMGAELDKIKENLQILSGRVDDNNLLIKRIVEKDTTPVDTLRADLAELTNRVNSMEQRLAAIQSYLGLKPGADEGKVGVRPVEEGQPAPGPQQVVSPSTEEDLYSRSLELFKRAEYNEAIASFREFLKKYPKSDLADNAQFWIGEAYMALKQYEKAILAYQKVIEAYPAGNKVPNAMLRQAAAFYEINDKVSSRLLLKKVIKKFPGSKEAKIAQVRLKTFK